MDGKVRRSAGGFPVELLLTINQDITFKDAESLYSIFVNGELEAGA